jgi:hypothetical protein
MRFDLIALIECCVGVKGRITSAAGTEIWVKHFSVFSVPSVPLCWVLKFSE